MLVQGPDCIRGCVSVDLDVHANVRLARIGCIVESGEGCQVNVTVELDRQVAQLDSPRRGVEGVPNRHACAHRTQQHFSRIGRRIGAAERCGLVHTHRPVTARLEASAEAVLPLDA
jgi:hypothetical protein